MNRISHCSTGWLFRACFVLSGQAKRDVGSFRLAESRARKDNKIESGGSLGQKK